VIAGETGVGLTLRVNGREAAVSVDPDTPLLYVLRNHLGLKGTRFGCGMGLCGACMVLVDGRAVTSCDLPVSAVADADIQTVEGLATDRELHPLQRAFVEEGAGQCGYCLSGILMSAKALLDRNPTPDDAEIRAALEPNICRCGSHPRILRAVQRASAEPR
jgi:nicotinate dehydrogenase subunit A